jgi:hypothetical protein
VSVCKLCIARAASNTVNRDIQVLKTYGAAPYAAELKKLEKEIKEKQTSVNDKIGRCTHRDAWPG